MRPQEHNLNKLGKGLIDDATNQISRPYPTSCVFGQETFFKFERSF